MLRALILAALLLVAAGSARAHLPGVPMQRTEQAPVIDGRLEDEVWRKAALLGPLTQVEPKEGAAPTQRTEVRLLFDRDMLYVAIRCFDSEPGKIRAAQFQRDGDLSGDDTIRITLDPFRRKRDGYSFGTNANGVKRDGLINQNGDLRFEWDTIWRCAAQRDELGWSVEMAIPFKSLSFDRAVTTWGLNVERFIARTQEVDRWSSPSRNVAVTTLGGFGEIRGLSGLQQGLGLDVKPYVTLKFSESPGGRRRSELKPGLDAIYRLTPSLTATVTINTDFADAEVDERRVNLTRFSLFFPEKRDFFLQDASLFSFGGVQEYPLPFFSRRIGLGVDGRIVDILAGAKLTGRIGDLSVGLLNVQTGSSGGVDGKNLTVFRPAYQVFGESSVGAILTYGDPLTSGRNLLAGVDFNLLNSKFLGDGQLTGHAFFMRTWSSPATRGDPFAAAISLGLDKDPWSFFGYASNIGSGFQPALGFTPVVGAREFVGSVQRRWRFEGFVRTVEATLNPFVLTDTRARVLTWELALPRIAVTSAAGDFFQLQYLELRDQLFAPFEISPGVIIPPGDYRYRRIGGRLSTSAARPLAVSLEGYAGSLYRGHSWQLRPGFDWRISKHLALSAFYDYRPIELPEGSFRVRIVSARLGVAFSSELSWNTLAQYDSFSRQFGINSRVKWIVRPGSDVFLVFNQGFDVEGNRFRRGLSELNLKAGWTFQF